MDLKDVHSKSHSEMIPSGRCFYPGQILAGKLSGNLDQIKYVEEELTLKRNKKGVPISKRVSFSFIHFKISILYFLVLCK